MRVRGFGLFLVALAAGLVLFRFPPAAYAFYPRCPIHELTGLLCPGCGATRALAALLHGQFGEAFHQNALFVLLLPCAAVYLALCRGRTEARGKWRTPSGPMLAGLLLVTAVFTLLRNLA